MPELSSLVRVIARTRAIATLAERGQLLDSLCNDAQEGATVVDFFNQHAGNLAVSNAQFRADFLAADCVLRDGIGARLAFKLFGRDGGLNMNGTDLIPILIQHFSQRHPDAPLFIFGTDEPWLQRGAARLAVSHQGPLVTADGFRAVEDYQALLCEYAAMPKLVVLGMGMPRQEYVAQQLKSAICGPMLIVCGGAIIDFAAGKVARAPAWIRACGLEWLYRLACEPRRLFNRYVIGIPVFVMRVVLSRLKSPQLTAATDASLPNADQP